MPAIGNQSLTLADHAKRQDPHGKVAKIVEILGQTNEILTDLNKDAPKDSGPAVPAGESSLLDPK